jgi:hypothetical protein
LTTDLLKPFLAGGTLQDRHKWTQIKTAVSAWWRPGVDENGRIRAFLAMRYDLFDNLRIPSEFATDQTNFRKLGCKWGIFADAADSKCVRGRLTDGTRLAVLSAKMTDRILAQSTEVTAEDEEQSEATEFADATDTNDTSADRPREIFDEQPA